MGLTEDLVLQFYMVSNIFRLEILKINFRIILLALSCTVIQIRQSYKNFKLTCYFNVFGLIMIFTNIFVINLFAVQNLKMALKKANILQHTKSFFV